MRHCFKLLLLTTALMAWFATSAQDVKPQPVTLIEKAGGVSLYETVDTPLPAADKIVPQGQIKADEALTTTVRGQVADNASLFKQDKSKRLKSQVNSGETKSLKVVKVTKKIANVPEGYSQITLNVLDSGDAGTGVWGDGTGYQMLLDADHSTYGSTIPETGALTTSGDVPAATYALFEYKLLRFIKG